MGKKIYYVIVLAVIFLTSCSEKKLDLKNILGVEIDLINKDYEYGDYLSFSGEGYTGLVYSLSNTEMDSIINKIKNQELPLEKESFNRQVWTKTPIKKEDIVTLVSSYYSKDKEFLKFQKEVEKITTESNGYFSYYYKDSDGNIDDIELYVLDLKHNKIYIIRHSV